MNKAIISKSDLLSIGMQYYIIRKKQHMSVKITMIGVCLILSTSQLIYGQVTEKINNDFISYAGSIIDPSQFKDSTAIYTCQLQLIVDRKNPLGALLSSNDTTVSRYLKHIETLKAFDFKGLMGNHERVCFRIPIAVTVIDSKYGKQSIDANSMSKYISMLYIVPAHMKNKLHTIQMFPLIVTIDKKIYD